MLSKQERIDLKNWAKEHSWESKMKQSKGLDSFDNYMGPNYGNMISVLGLSRDGDLRDQSNFKVALDMLGRESKHVRVNRFSHWGCGYFDLIMVDSKALSKVRIAREIKDILLEYPLLDESDYYEREYDYIQEYADNTKEDVAEALSHYFGLKLNKSLVNLAYALTVICQQYQGLDKTLRYSTRYKLNQRDIDQYKTVCKELKNTSLKYNKKLLNQLILAIDSYKIEKETKS